MAEVSELLSYARLQNKYCGSFKLTHGLTLVIPRKQQKKLLHRLHSATTTTEDERLLFVDVYARSGVL
jgi:ATP-dependent Zn protease